MMLFFYSPLLLVLCRCVFWFQTRYIPDEREVATALELPDRGLFSHVVKAAPPRSVRVRVRDLGPTFIRC